jgi:membrane protease YdiL (CAAX protease family)
METEIGRGLTDSRPRAAAAVAVAALVVLADLALVRSGDYSYLGLRAAVPLLALVPYLILAGGARGPVGLKVRPLPGVRYWFKTTLAIGAAIGTIIVAAIIPLRWLGWELPLHSTSPDLFWSEFVRMCLLAPAVEEGTYRVGLCCGIVGLLRPAGAIAASGFIFGALHVLYGNPGPDNLVAGFFLAWAYLKSGTILVPMALHALGNLCVLASWIAFWYSS